MRGRGEKGGIGGSGGCSVRAGGVGRSRGGVGWVPGSGRQGTGRDDHLLVEGGREAASPRWGSTIRPSRAGQPPGLLLVFSRCFMKDTVAAWWSRWSPWRAGEAGGKAGARLRPSPQTPPFPPLTPHLHARPSRSQRPPAWGARGPAAKSAAEAAAPSSDVCVPTLTQPTSA